jgi:hypothetical protein
MSSVSAAQEWTLAERCYAKAQGKRYDGQANMGQPEPPAEGSDGRRRDLTLFSGLEGLLPDPNRKLCHFPCEWWPLAATC